MANQLFDAEAGLVAITAVAPHMAIQEIVREAKGPIVNLLDAVPEALEAAGFERVAVFGNRAVMDTNIYNTLGPEAVVQLDPAVIEAVHNTYNDIALTGKRGTAAEIDVLDSIAEQALAEGAQAVILAGTDLSSFYSQTPPDYPHMDLATAHIDQIMESHPAR